MILCHTPYIYFVNAKTHMHMSLTSVYRTGDHEIYGKVYLCCLRAR